MLRQWKPQAEQSWLIYIYIYIYIFFFLHTGHLPDTEGARQSQARKEAAKQPRPVRARQGVAALAFYLPLGQMASDPRAIIALDHEATGLISIRDVFSLLYSLFHIIVRP